MLTLTKTDTILKPKLFKKGLLHQWISQSGESSQQLGSRELPQYRNKKLLTTYFFTGHTLFKTLLFYNYYFPPLSDPQDADTDSDIDNASERKTK